MDQKANNRILAKDEHFLFKPSSEGELKVVLCYPNSYQVAMSNLGYQTVYRFLAEDPRVKVERAFIPEKHPNEAIRTFETNSLISNADILALSVSFEMDYPRVLIALEAAGLDFSDCWETKDSQREAVPCSSRPFLLGGGVALTLNPEPVANLFDAILIGEGDEALSEIISFSLRRRKEIGRIEEMKERLATVKGVYIPSSYRVNYDDAQAVSGFEHESGVFSPVEKRYVEKLDLQPSHTAISTPHTEMRDMFMTETGRGCEQACRFCVSGYVYRPVRRRSAEAISRTLSEGASCCQSVGFVGAAVSGHPAIVELLEQAAESGTRASLSSVMSHKVSSALAESLAKNQLKSLALAPETGSEDLRFRMGKRVKNEEIFSAACVLFEAGLRTLKLYFMVGLPTEREQDVLAIAEFSAEMQKRAIEVLRQKGLSVAPKLLLSVNAFIPKPWTPFQRHPFLELRELKRRMKLLRGQVGRIPGVELKSESARESYVQALFSRGDRRVGDLLLAMHQGGVDWREIVRSGNKKMLETVPEPDYFVYQGFSEKQRLPWEILDLRIRRSMLEQEYRQALAETEGPN